MFVAEVREGVELIEDSADGFRLGELTFAGDCDDLADLCCVNRLLIRALPGAVVDLVGVRETLVVLGERFGRAGFAGHILERFRGFERFCLDHFRFLVNFVLISV